LDTSVSIAALRSSSGAAAEILRLIFLGEITLCLDFNLAGEYRDVAMRPAQQWASGLHVAAIERLVFRLEQAAEAVEVLVRHRPLSMDPADDMLLDVAINGEVDAIVTHNLKHVAVPGRRFGIPVMVPGEFLMRMRQEA
jgi:putative PIN family toxin of toxin-antitoxin system